MGDVKFLVMSWESFITLLVISLSFICLMFMNYSANYTHTRLMALFPGLPGWAGTRKVKSIWILLKQETVSGSGIVASAGPYASLHLARLAPDR